MKLTTILFYILSGCPDKQVSTASSILMYRCSSLFYALLFTIINSVIIINFFDFNIDRSNIFFVIFYTPQLFLLAVFLTMFVKSPILALSNRGSHALKMLIYFQSGYLFFMTIMLMVAHVFKLYTHTVFNITDVYMSINFYGTLCMWISYVYIVGLFYLRGSYGDNYEY